MGNVGGYRYNKYQQYLCFDMEEKLLLKDYLENSNLYSLYKIIFVLYGAPLKSIIAKVKKNTDSYELESVLTDFYDNLIEPTKTGEKKLRTFDFDKELLPYIKQSLRSYLNEEFKTEQQKQETEKSMDESDLPLVDKIDEGYIDYSETFGALIDCITDSKGISKRDKYIVLTYLLCKIGNPCSRDLDIYENLSKQLGISQSAAKKAAQRGRDDLKERIKSNI